jgi:hypothetical protein
VTMSRTVPAWLGRIRAWPRRVIALVVALVLAAVLAWVLAWVLVERARPTGPTARPALRRVLEALVTGSHPSFLNTALHPAPASTRTGNNS